MDDTEDTSDSSTGSDEKVAPQPQTIKIRGVIDWKMAAICKHYFENPDKGGGKIEEFKWDNIEHIFYIKFADAKGNRMIGFLYFIDIKCSETTA